MAGVQPFMTAHIRAKKKKEREKRKQCVGRERETDERQSWTHDVKLTWQYIRCSVISYVPLHSAPPRGAHTVVPKDYCAAHAQEPLPLMSRRSLKNLFLHFFDWRSKKKRVRDILHARRATPCSERPIWIPNQCPMNYLWLFFLPSHLQATGTLIGFEIVARRLVSSAPRGAI